MPNLCDRALHETFRFGFLNHGLFLFFNNLEEVKIDISGSADVKAFSAEVDGL